MFAHRGGAALAPENTITAFDRGLACGADGLELDVCLSRDGVVVVHHDTRLERTTNLQGAVADRTAAELAKADAAFSFDASHGFPLRGRGIGVPTLADVLARYRDVPIVIELKDNRAELARRVIDVVRAANAPDRVCVGAVDLRVLRTLRALAPEVATGAAHAEVRWALYRSWCHWPVARARYCAYQVPERVGSTRVVSPRFVNEARRAGLAVQVWTVDAPDDARRLLTWGVDALITDRPDLTAPVVREHDRTHSQG